MATQRVLPLLLMGITWNRRTMVRGTILMTCFAHFRLFQIDHRNGELYRQGLQDLVFRDDPHAHEELAPFPPFPSFCNFERFGELLLVDMPHSYEKITDR